MLEGGSIMTQYIAYPMLQLGLSEYFKKMEEEAAAEKPAKKDATSESDDE